MSRPPLGRLGVTGGALPADQSDLHRSGHHYRRSDDRRTAPVALGALNIYLTMAELRRHSAKQFDPVVVAATLKMLDKDESSIQPAVGPDPDSMADVAELPQATAEQRSTQLTATGGC